MSDKFETLLATHAEHIKKLSVEELTDGTLDLLVRDALTQAKCLGAIADAPEVPPVENSEACNVCGCDGSDPTHNSCAECVCWSGGDGPGVEPSTASPADEGNEQPWAIMEVEPPPLGRLVEVCRVTGGGIDNRHPRVRRWGGDWWLDLHSKSVGENANAWKFWRDVRVEALEQPKADEGQKWTVVWGMDNRLCCKVCGHPFLGISGDWTHVCQPKADAPVEMDEPPVDNSDAAILERAAVKWKADYERCERNRKNAFTQHDIATTLRDSAYRQRNDVIRQRDELRAQLAQANAEKVAAMGEATKVQDELRVVRQDADTFRVRYAQAAKSRAALHEAGYELAGRIGGILQDMNKKFPPPF